MKIKNKFIVSLLYFALGCNPALINNSNNTTIQDVNKSLLDKFDYNKELIIAFHSNEGSLYAVLKDTNEDKTFNLGDTLTVEFLKFEPTQSITYKLTSLDEIISIEINKKGERTYYIPIDSLQYQQYIKTIKSFLK